MRAYRGCSPFDHSTGYVYNVPPVVMNEHPTPIPIRRRSPQVNISGSAATATDQPYQPFVLESTLALALKYSHRLRYRLGNEYT